MGLLTSAQKTLAYKWGSGDTDGSLGAPGFFQVTAGTFTNNSPSSGKVAWAGVVVSYQGAPHTITDNNSGTNKWIVWKLSAPTVFTSYATPQALGNDEFYVCMNVSGTAVSLWNSTAPDAQILPNLVAAVQGAFGTLSAIVADIGTITAGSITGVTIQTAASGARVVMNSSSIKGYDGSNNEIFSIASGVVRCGSVTGITSLYSDTYQNFNIYAALAYVSVSAIGLKVNSTLVSLEGHGHGGSDINSGTLDLARMPAAITGRSSLTCTGNLATDGNCFALNFSAASGGAIAIGSTSITEAQLQTIKTHCGA